MPPPSVAVAVVIPSSSSSSSSAPLSLSSSEAGVDGEEAAVGEIGTAAAVGCGTGLVLGSAVGFAVGLVSTEDTEEIVALLNPRSDTTDALKEASCR